MTRIESDDLVFDTAAAAVVVVVVGGGGSVHRPGLRNQCQIHDYSLQCVLSPPFFFLLFSPFLLNCSCLSQFAQITQVTYPPIYEDFLETIGLFSFDLGWVLSASCLATKITFYDKLL